MHVFWLCECILPSSVVTITMGERVKKVLSHCVVQDEARLNQRHRKDYKQDTARQKQIEIGREITRHQEGKS
jgi:hypothetical protein